MQLPSNWVRWVLYIVIPLVTIVTHWQVFSKDLMGQHVWRQTETQTVIRNFATEDFNILNPRVENLGYENRILRKEFPLLQWLIAGVDRLLGYDVRISRIMMLLICWMTVWGTYRLLKHLTGNNMAALTGAWFTAFAPVMFYYGVNPLPDPLALCFSVWGLAMFCHPSGRYRYVALFLFGLASLVKLPYILFYVVPGIWWLQGIIGKTLSRRKALRFAGVGGVTIWPAIVWYAIVIPDWSGNPVVAGIADKNAVGLITILEVIQINLVSTLPEWLLGYGVLLLFIAGIVVVLRKGLLRKAKHLPLIGLFFALVAYYIYVIPVALHYHDYYLLPFMPFLAMPVALGTRWLVAKMGRNGVLMAAFFALILLGTTLLRTKNSWNPDDPKFNRDLLVHHEQLQLLIPEEATVVVAKDVTGFVWLYYLDRKGYYIAQDQYKGSPHLEQADYLLTDIPEGASSPGELIWASGSLQLWVLK